MSGLKLSHAGLALVFALLTLELIFVASLAGLLNEAEKSAARESHSKEIVGVTNHLMQLFYDAGTAASDYQTENAGPPAARIFHESMDKVPAAIASLKKLVKNDRHYYKTVCRIERSGIKTLALVSYCMKLAEAGNMPTALMAAKKVKPAFQASKKALFDDLRGLMAEQEKIIAESPAAQARTRQVEKQILLAGVGANILIAIALALFLVKGITRRLDIMVANTVLLVKNEKLFPPMKGNDEIARLDNSFHKMAESLKELEEMKRQFVSMVSHDLRTPLTSLHMFLEMLEAGTYGELNQTGTQRTAVAERSVTRLIALINDLLDFERIQAGQLKIERSRISLKSIVSRSIDAVNAFAENQKVKLIAEAIEFDAIADGDRLIQVLVNLISNAVKFSPAGSTVTVSARQIEDAVEISVQDQGRGIPEALQSEIFERFKQVKETDKTEKGGTGLGLAICKAIVEGHGGKISVKSKEEEGSTFYFTLPDAYIKPGSDA